MPDNTSMLWSIKCMIEYNSLIQCILLFPVVFLLGVTLLTIIHLVNTTVPCTENNSKILQKGVKLARLMNRTTADIIKTYVSSSSS